MQHLDKQQQGDNVELLTSEVDQGCESTALPAAGRVRIGLAVVGMHAFWCSRMDAWAGRGVGLQILLQLCICLA